MLKRFLFGAIFVYLAYSACNSNNRLEDIEAGSFTISSNSQSTVLTDLSYQQTFTTSFSSIPNIILSLHGFFFSSTRISEWHIVPKHMTTSKALFEFHHNPSEWVLITLGFWASSNPNIVLGINSVNFDLSQGPDYSLPIKINTPIQNQNNTFVRSFLNGFITPSTSVFDYKLYHELIGTKDITFGVKTSGNTKIFKIYISYIVIYPTSNMISYGGTISEVNFINSKVYNLQRNVLHVTPYKLFGLISAKFSISFNSRMNAKVDSQFYMRVDSTVLLEQLTIVFIAIGIPIKNMCSSCFQKFISEDQCVQSCFNNQYSVTYQNSGAGCRTCPTEYGYTINNNRSGCTCSTGLVYQNGICSNGGRSQISSFFSSSNGSSSQGASASGSSGSSGSGTNPNFPNTPQVPFPSFPSSNPTIQTQSSGLSYQPLPVRDCSSQPNTYWTGYQCSCRPGYKRVNGFCTSISFTGEPTIQKPSYPTNCNGSNQFFDGQLCRCMPGYSRNTFSNKCQPQDNCYLNSHFSNDKCICNSGYVIKGAICVRPDVCQSNQFFNGIQCACMPNFYLENGVCLPGTPCAPYSIRSGSECICIQGYSKYNGFCSKCSDGKIEVNGVCVLLCGSNEINNFLGNGCICKFGYGRYNNVCSICPHNFFIFNQYCVLCPIGSTYNSAINKCECQLGLILNSQGYCQFLCTSTEIYDVATNECNCKQGLGLVNGKCQVCIGGHIDPDSKLCFAGCKYNEVLIGNKCLCEEGLGLNKNEQCIDCSTIAGGFFIDGFCASCPSEFIHQGSTCICPPGMKLNLGKCINSCQIGQLTDESGYCYQCPLNEEIKNGKCICKPGFTKIDNFCRVLCKANRYLINGLCAICALNTVYSSKLNACICPPFFYMNNYGVCEMSTLPPLQCNKGQYYSPSEGCLYCPSDCSECKSAFVCTKCIRQGYSPSGSICGPKCGDGFLFPEEECDDNNSFSNDGCSNLCKIEPGYSCIGSPSACSRSGSYCGDGLISFYQQCDDRNNFNNDGCTNCRIDSGYRCSGEPSICQNNPNSQGLALEGQVLYNTNNIYVTLRTTKTLIFSSDTQMRNFINYKFPDQNTQPNSVYCLQKPIDPQLFQCLLIYGSSVPNQSFIVQFSYNYKGDQGFINVPMDAGVGGFNTRSLG